MIKFTMVSVISALTSLVVLAIVYGVLRLWSEVPSVLFANLTAGIPSYILNRRWVWGKIGSLTPGEGDPALCGHLRHRNRVLPVHCLAGPPLRRRAPPAPPGPDRRWCRFTNIASFGILWVFKFLILNRLFAQIPDVEVAAEA